MDSWKNLRRRMEKALELFNLQEALSHLDALISSASSPSEVASLLRNHTLRALPTLHYLTGFQFREDDIPHLERLIRSFTEFGYDINKTLPPGVRRFASHGTTALLVSVKKENVILVECLLRCGARADVRDPQGFSPCHWAIKNGSLKCLQVLLEHEGASLVKSAPVKNKILPLLHEAVNSGHLEVVSYLLSKQEELGLDVNEKGRYHFPYGYSYSCTPLIRALDMESTPIIQVLIKHPGAKPSRFEELHRLLATGLTKQALPLLEYFSDEELSTDKIKDQWALHTINGSAFVDEDYVEYTKELILEYVRRGWDPNSLSSSTKYVEFDEDQGREIQVTITKYNLLHLACIYKGPEIIKLLVSDLGVDVNRKLEGEGQLELTPLLILLNSVQYEDATYLIEKGADLNVRGNLKMISADPQGLRLMRTNLTTGNLELKSSLNPVELLIRMGDELALPLLDQVLARPDVILQGANEFHLALEGKNPVCIAKVLKRCAEMISKEDLNLVTLWNDNKGEPEEVPSLVWLLDLWMPGMKDFGALEDLLKLMVQLGYDLNSQMDPHQSCDRLRDLLIFYILRYDMKHGTSHLLRAILQFDHLQLNVTDVYEMTPVEFLLYAWENSCSSSTSGSMCWRNRDLQHPPILETVKLLLAHGLDVSGLVIGTNFTYHRGYNLILKVLYRAGAKISEEFFTNPHICFVGTDDRDALVREMEELKEWKDDFDRETGFTLKHISGLRVRKMLKCVGDLKMLDGLPKGLKEEVMGTVDEPSSSLLLWDRSSEDEWSDESD